MDGVYETRTSTPIAEASGETESVHRQGDLYGELISAFWGLRWVNMKGAQGVQDTRNRLLGFEYV